MHVVVSQLTQHLWASSKAFLELIFMIPATLGISGRGVVFVRPATMVDSESLASLSCNHYLASSLQYMRCNSPLTAWGLFVRAVEHPAVPGLL